MDETSLDNKKLTFIAAFITVFMLNLGLIHMQFSSLNHDGSMQTPVKPGIQNQPLHRQMFWQGNTPAIWSGKGRSGAFLEGSGFDPRMHTLRIESLGLD